jgi:death-on-curing protein
MNDPAWVLEEVAQAIHSMLLAEHGGASGIRDKGLLDSALSIPKHKLSYEPESSIFDIAVAYSFAIAKNHPFVDGNKRTAFTIGTLFLEINGYQLNAPEPNAAIIFEKLAAGTINELGLAQWFEEHSSKV